MKIIYNIDKNKYIKIFGKKFVENNKDNCFLIVNDKFKELSEFYDYSTEKKSKHLKIKLIESNSIVNMSYMFYECSSLYSLSDISNWDFSKVKNLDYMLLGCSSLSELPDFSKWNIDNITSMSYIFNDNLGLLNTLNINFEKVLKKNEMTLIYNIKNNNSKVRIFGQQFVKNNKDKCILLILFF